MPLVLDGLGTSSNIYCLKEKKTKQKTSLSQMRLVQFLKKIKSLLGRLWMERACC